MTIATQATVGVTTFNQESKGNQTRIKLESTITLVSKNTSSHPVRSGWMVDLTMLKYFLYFSSSLVS